jgi:hypothetical protein
MIKVSKDGDPMPKEELGRAVVDDDGTVVYSEDEDGGMLKSLFENHMEALGVTAPEFAKQLNRDGWSNGYIMIDTGSK